MNRKTLYWWKKVRRCCWFNSFNNSHCEITDRNFYHTDRKCRPQCCPLLKAVDEYRIKVKVNIISY